jgi:cysteinyl-tRNA synthetase
MDDDFNTADAIGSIFELVRAANTAAAVPGVPAGALKDALAQLRELCGVLGVACDEKSQVPSDVQALVDQRAAARAAKDWKRSDGLRAEIRALGFDVKDTPQGQQVTPL